MRNLLLLIALTFITSISFAQNKIYTTSSGEVIFGFSDAAYNQPGIPPSPALPNNNVSGSITDAMRFTIWFHLGYYFHYDFNNNFGLYTGITNRNIGFITKEAASKETTDLVKWKRRSYTAGIPLALKFGSFDNDFYFFAGGQYEMFYHYKEKEFLPSGKRKYTEWFSDRVNMFIPSVFAGVTFKKGLSIKFTYTLNDMMNKDYSYSDATGATIFPYKHMDSKLLYVSVFVMIRSDNDTYQKTVNKEERKQVAFL